MEGLIIKFTYIGYYVPCVSTFLITNHKVLISSGDAFWE